MKSVLQAVLLLSLAVPAFSAAPGVDFDGAHSKSQSSGFTESLSSLQVPVPSPGSNIDGSVVFEPRQGLSAPSGNSTPVAETKILRITETGVAVEVPLEEAADGKGYYKFKPNDLIEHKIWCPSQSGYWGLCYDYKFDPRFAGHNHTTNIPPYTWNGYPIPAHRCYSNIPVSNTMVFYFKAPEFATRADHTAQISGACYGPVSSIFDIKIDGLVALPPAWSDSLHGGVTYYTLIGTTTHHPVGNHFGKPSTITSLQQIAWNYYLEFSTFSAFSRLEVNDMSLRWGGLFDIAGNWAPNHHEHRYGRQVDLRRIIWNSSGEMVFMPENQEKKLIKEACKFNVQVLRENKDGRLTDPLLTQDWGSASTAPHFHLRFPLTGDDSENPLDITPNLANCEKLLNE